MRQRISNICYTALIAFFVVTLTDVCCTEPVVHRGERFLIVDILPGRATAQDIGILVENIADGRRSTHTATVLGFHKADFPFIRRGSLLTCDEFYRETPLLEWVIQDILACVVRPENLSARHLDRALLVNGSRSLPS